MPDKSSVGQIPSLGGYAYVTKLKRLRMLKLSDDFKVNKW